MKELTMGFPKPMPGKLFARSERRREGDCNNNGNNNGNNNVNRQQWGTQQSWQR
jgi:hypothetical protein